MEEWIDALNTQDMKVITQYIDGIDLNNIDTEEAEALLSALILFVYQEFPDPPYSAVKIGDRDIISEGPSIEQPGDVRLLEGERDLTQVPFDVYSAIQYLLGHFEAIRSVQTRTVPMMTLIATYRTISPTAISYVAMVNDLSLLTILLDMPQCLPYPNAEEVLLRLVRIFDRENLLRAYDPVYNPDQGRRLGDLIDASQIRLLLQVSDLFQHTLCYNWFLDQYRNVSQAAPEPQWMLPLPEHLQGMLPLPDQTATIQPTSYPPAAVITNYPMLASIVTQVLDPSLMEASIPIIESEMRISTFDELQRHYQFPIEMIMTHHPSSDQWLLQPSTGPMISADDLEWFRLLGPRNPFTSEYENPREDPDYPGDGEDRMFLSTIYNLTENEHPMEIFSGVCHFCANRIADARYALRLPVEGGGWYGSYCSFDCIRRMLDDSRSKRATQMNVDAVSAAVDRLEAQIRTYGIYKATSNP